MNPILMKIFGITRTTHSVSIGIKQVVYHFSFLNRDFTMSKLESTIN